MTSSSRWLLCEGQVFADHNVTILGDDLYSHEPFYNAITSQNMHFILVCKPDLHKTLYEWLVDFERKNQVLTITRRDGKHTINDTYRLMNAFPLRDDDEAMMVS